MPNTAEEVQDIPNLPTTDCNIFGVRPAERTWEDPNLSTTGSEIGTIRPAECAVKFLESSSLSYCLAMKSCICYFEICNKIK